jgi:hypothetical protein
MDYQRNRIPPLLFMTYDLDIGVVGKTTARRNKNIGDQNHHGKIIRDHKVIEQGVGGRVLKIS